MPNPAPPSDLVDPILILALRHLTCTSATPLADIGPHISAVLNVLPRALTPDVTKAALFSLPWIDLDAASKLGDTDLLDFMLKWSTQPLGRPVQYSSDALTLASWFGHTHVLDWWWDKMQQGALFVYWTVDAVDRASEFGQVDVLDWWWNKRAETTGKSFKYSYRAMDRASARGCVDVLQWWLEHCSYEVEPLYSEQAVRGAAANGMLETLYWWSLRVFEQQIDMPELSSVLKDAAESGSVEILDWLARQGVEEDLDWEDMDLDSAFWEPALTNGQMAVLEWWDAIGHSLPNRWIHQPNLLVWWAAKSADAEVLKWLAAKPGWLTGVRSDLMLLAIESTTRPRTGDAEMDASMVVDALDFIRDSPLLLGGADDESVLPAPVISPELLSAAIKHGHGPLVLDWLISHLDCQWAPSNDDVKAATMRGDVDTLQWFVDRAQFVPSTDFMAPGANWAVAGAHLPVLEWWHQRGSKYGRQQLLLLAKKAAADGNIDLFAWCVGHENGRSARSITEFHPVIDIASYCGHIGILQWWRDWCLQHGIKNGQYTVTAMDEASALGKVDSLQWWLSCSTLPESSLPLLFTADALTIDRSPLTVDGVLNWWVWSGLLAQFKGEKVSVMSELPAHGNVNWLYRLSKAGLMFSVSESMIVDASAGGHVCVLGFLMSLGESVVPSALWSSAVDDAVMAAITKHQGHVLDWWKRQDVQSSKSGVALADLLDLIAP